MSELIPLSVRVVGFYLFTGSPIFDTERSEVPMAHQMERLTPGSLLLG
jgi:hypothetical protein